jgi:hypothetical protein
MGKRFIFLISALFITFMLSGQENSNEVGIRGGLTSGVEYRHFFKPDQSGKLLLGYRNKGFLIHGMYEVHRSDLYPATNQLDFVFGAGIHAGYQKWDKKRVEGQNEFTDVATQVVGGIDGLLALEYALGILPLKAGIEIKPFLDFGGKHGFDAIPWDFAFTLKLQL